MECGQVTHGEFVVPRVRTTVVLDPVDAALHRVAIPDGAIYREPPITPSSTLPPATCPVRTRCSPSSAKLHENRSPRTVAAFFQLSPSTLTGSVITAFERVLGQDLVVQTVAPGQRMPQVPDFVSELAAALATYDSPLDMTDLARAYGVAQTTIADFLEGSWPPMLAASSILRISRERRGNQRP